MNSPHATPPFAVTHTIADADLDKFRAWADGLTTGGDDSPTGQTIRAYEQNSPQPTPDFLTATAKIDDQDRVTITAIAWFRPKPTDPPIDLETLGPGLTALWEFSDAGHAQLVSIDRETVMFSEIIEPVTAGPGNHPRPHVIWIVKQDQ